jgi:hypothetical protein
VPALFKMKLEIDQGATFRNSIVWSAGTPSTPVDLTGFKGKMQLRDIQKLDTLILELTTENGRLAISSIPGQLDMYISATDTKAMNFIEAAYDVFITAPGTDGDTTHFLSGTAVLTKAITR